MKELTNNCGFFFEFWNDDYISKLVLLLFKNNSYESKEPPL
jgi:hypothetical protein